jgi:hypothetical protein
MRAVKGLGVVPPDHLEINGKRLSGELLRIVLDAEVRRTIAGASTVTLTIDDPNDWLLQSGLYQPSALPLEHPGKPPLYTDLEFDGLWFRSCALNTESTPYKWQFEARAVALLRHRKKPRHISRAHSTLAQFLKSLVAEEPSIGFVAPELTKRQPIADHTQAEKQSARDQGVNKGIGYGSGITVKGVKATKAQIDILNRALVTAESHAVSNDRAAIALIVAIIDESEAQNLEHETESSGDSRGILQYQISKFGRAKALDPEWCVTNFLTAGATTAGGAIKIALEHPSWTPAEIASVNQGNREGPSVYAPYEAEAKKILQAYGDMTPGPSADTAATYVKQFNYGRGEPTGPRGEDTWACGNRYAELVGWRWFEVANKVYWVSDYDLIRARPLMTPIDRNSSGINSIGANLDISAKKPDTVTISCRAAAWGAPPGSVVTLAESLGPNLAGAWIVAEVGKPSIGLLNATVILTRPTPPKAEPSSSIVVRPDGSPGEDQGGLPEGTAVMKALAKAQWIAAQKFPYIWGGGHRSDGTFGPSDTAGGYVGQVGYDCSGMVDDILHSAGLIDSSPNVEGLEKWGEAGKGKYMTVWVKPPNEHTFIEFDLPTGTVFYEAKEKETTVGEERQRDTTGMLPRHWPGT